MDPVTSLAVEDYLVLPDTVDLTNCDREAIHIPGGIQQHGVLLALDPDDATVVIASANAGEVLGHEGHAVGARLHDLFEPASTEALVRTFDTGGLQRRHLAVATPDGARHDAVIHRSQGLILLELEPHIEVDTGALFDEVTDASAAIGTGGSLTAARAAVAGAVRRLTGFDRVMVYLFHEDGHGEVVAEDRRDDLEPFLGLHYPASDVPQQARLLYVRNWTRQIADSGTDAVPLEPARLPTNDHPLNLAHAQLRAVSPIHLEYLRNMGVATSLSLSLVDDGKLVGLIACHHYRPRHIPFMVRSACELLARLMSEQLARAGARHRDEAERERQRIQLGVLRHVAEAGTTQGALVGIEQRSVAAFGATAFHGVIAGVEHRSGPLPISTDVIDRALADARDDVVACEDATEYGGDPDCGGLLVVRIGDGGHLAWMRPPVARTLRWGGDPDEGRDEKTGEKLSPRASFDAFVETVRGRCAPWTGRDLRLAETLRRVLGTNDQEHQEGRDVSTVVQALTAYADELQQANDELLRAATAREEMISAVAHDLRGPLRTMSGFSGMIGKQLTDGGDAGAVAPLADRIVDAAEHMSALLDGLQRWGRLGDAITPTTVDLTQAVRTVLEGLRSQLDEAEAVVDVAPLLPVQGDPVLLRELLQNLVENAVKYRAPDRRPRIAISTETSVGGAIRLSVADNGLGIPPDRLEDVFRVFRQLQPGHVGGIGLGLSLVQRIAERHGGKVWVDSILGSGSVFHVHLPAAQVSS